MKEQLEKLLHDLMVSKMAADALPTSWYRTGIQKRITGAMELVELAQKGIA